MSKGKSTTTTTTDPAQMAMYQDLYNKAQGIAQQPFVPYTGSRVAGFNPDQLTGFDATRGMFNQSMGFDPRNQLNNLANMSAPSVNLPFGYSQPQQPSPIFQPMPITGGGRPTPPPSIGGVGGGGPVFPSPTPDTGYDPMPKMTMGKGPGYFGDNPEFLAGQKKLREELIADGFDPDTPVQAFGSTPTRINRMGEQVPVSGFKNNVPGGGGINYGGPGGGQISDLALKQYQGSIGNNPPRPKIEPVRSNPFRRGPQPVQTNPFSPTQLGPAAMQQASTVRPVERFGGANVTQLANFGGANIDPVERFGAADISPVDLYSGASVNRGDVRDVRPQSLLDTDLGAYQNPFQSQVIDNTLDDLNRARQLQIQSDQDAAIGRGAFGGSRSALLESETNRNFAEQAARTAGDLRARGFDTATSLAGQDIGRQFDADKFMSDADKAIAMQNASFGQQAGLARQGLLGDVSLNQARLDQQAGLAGIDAYNRAVSQQAQLDASRFGANQNALNQFGLQQGQFDNQMNMGMFDAANRAAFMQPELDMRNRQFQAGLLGDQLSDQYRSLGMLSGIGSQQQGLQQAGMDAAYNEFLRAIGYGPQQLGLLAQGVSALPTQSNVSQSYKPGMGDVLGGAAGLLGSAWTGGFNPFGLL